MITLKLGDITQEDVEAIVNAANSGLLGGRGVDGAIHRAAGSEVMKECREIGSCKTGDAVMTNAGQLKAKRIIHAVGPIWTGGRRGEPDHLKNCYERSFSLAKQNKLRTIAFPAISTGAYGYPKKDAARIALETGKMFEKDFDEIRFICYSQEDLAIYQDTWQQLSDT